MNGSLPIEYQVSFRSSGFVKLIDEVPNDDGLLVSEYVHALNLQGVFYPSTQVRIRRCVNKRGTHNESMKEVLRREGNIHFVHLGPKNRVGTKERQLQHENHVVVNNKKGN